MLQLTRRRGQRRRFSTSALTSHRDDHASEATSAPLVRAESLIPRPSTPNTLTFPRYSDIDSGEDGLQALFSQDETASGVIDMDVEPHLRAQTLQRRRRPRNDDLTLTRGMPTYNDLRNNYASLPSTPVVRYIKLFSPAPPLSVVVKEEEVDDILVDVFLSFSLWDYLREELMYPSTTTRPSSYVPFCRTGTITIPLTLKSTGHMFQAPSVVAGILPAPYTRSHSFQVLKDSDLTTSNVPAWMADNGIIAALETLVN